jgi:hypothetical protein
MPALLEKDLRATPDGVAVIHHKHFERCASCSQLLLLPMGKTNNAGKSVAHAIRQCGHARYLCFAIPPAHGSKYPKPLPLIASCRTRVNPGNRSLRPSRAHPICRSQLKGPSHRMQRLYPVTCAGCRFRATLHTATGPCHSSRHLPCPMTI